jgi:hypothetical protein
MTERFGAEIHGKDRGMPLSGVEEKQHDHLNAAGRELRKFRHSRDSGNLPAPMENYLRPTLL